ncbi:MAG TPA: DedA family protein [Patescibacteria group bacterium]|nr:DedA family protein [Patescibacteria group bacterium]
MHELINIIFTYINTLDYKFVFLLMTLESSFIPFPSEVIVPPAAYLAQQGQLNVFGVILAGILGSLAGAVINYFLAYYLGRIIIYRLADTKAAKVLLINSKKVERSEKFFLKYGNVSTFIGRLIPVVRQLISLPAGFSRMNFKRFCLFTSLGSGIWVVVLAVLGYFFGANQELLKFYYKEISFLFLFLVLAGVIIYIIAKRIRKNKGRSLFRRFF